MFGLLNAEGNDNSLELKIVGVDVKKTAELLERCSEADKYNRLQCTGERIGFMEDNGMFIYAKSRREEYVVVICNRISCKNSFLTASIYSVKKEMILSPESKA